MRILLLEILTLLGLHKEEVMCAINGMISSVFICKVSHKVFSETTAHLQSNLLKILSVYSMRNVYS